MSFLAIARLNVAGQLILILAATAIRLVSFLIKFAFGLRFDDGGLAQVAYRRGLYCRW